MPKDSPGTATSLKPGAAWKQNAKRALALAARRRRMSRVPVLPLQWRPAGLFGWVRELAPADRTLVDEYIRAHSR